MVAFAGFAIKLLLALLFWCDIEYLRRGGEISTLCLALSILTHIEYKSIKIPENRFLSILVGISLGASVLLRTVFAIIELKLVNNSILSFAINLKFFIAVLITAIGSAILNFIVINKVEKI